MFSKSFKQDSVLTPQSGIVDASGATGALAVPIGTTAQRPGTPVVGMQRWNTSFGTSEVYTGATNGWQQYTLSAYSYSATYLVIAGGGGGGTLRGGGGGAGGFLTATTTLNSGTAYTITVGAGGAGGAGGDIRRAGDRLFGQPAGAA